MALLLCSAGAWAEAPVGLDANGVDPRAAVSNSWGLDVRDADGRPVTQAKVLSDLKAAAVKRAGDNAYASSLPKAKAVLSALELLAEAAAAFRLVGGMITLPELLPSLPGGRPRVAILMCALLAMAAASVTYCCRASTRLAFVRSPQSSIQILRC